MKKVCETCKWYETYTGACCNGDSDYCADYVSSMNSCENWEVADNERYGMGGPQESRMVPEP